MLCGDYKLISSKRCSTRSLMTLNELEGPGGCAVENRLKHRDTETQREGDRNETLGDQKDTGRLYSVFSVTLCLKKDRAFEPGQGFWKHREWAEFSYRVRADPVSLAVDSDGFETGKRMVNAVPFPTVLSTRMRPRC